MLDNITPTSQTFDGIIHEIEKMPEIKQQDNLLNRNSFIVKCALMLYCNSVLDDPTTGSERNISLAASRAVHRAELLAQYLQKYFNE